MRIIALLIVLAALLPNAGWAQDAALDDKLRDLLHQTTTQLRAAEDNAATLQAQLDSMTKQRDQMQAQLATAQSKPVVPAASPAALQQAAAALAAARAENARLAAGAQRLQGAYARAADLARDKDASDQRNASGLKSASAALGSCEAANTKLVTLSTDILHLYETPQFNRLLMANHERLIGFKRVQLENLVQDYEDKIDAATYIAPPP